MSIAFIVDGILHRFALWVCKSHHADASILHSRGRLRDGKRGLVKPPTSQHVHGELCANVATIGYVGLYLLVLLGTLVQD